MRTTRFYIAKLGLYMARHVRTLFRGLRVVFGFSESHKSRITGTDQQLRDSNLESFGPKCGSRLTTAVASKDGRSCFTNIDSQEIAKFWILFLGQNVAQSNMCCSARISPSSMIIFFSCCLKRLNRSSGDLATHLDSD